MAFRSDVGIDLGTSSILVYVKGKGIVLQEPSVVAIDSNTNKFLAVGEDARKMLGRTPGNIQAIRPLKDGVISDYNITERMLKYFLGKALGKMLFRPRVIICVPSGVTQVEQRAVMEAANQAGAYKTYIIEEPIAAAIGAGLDITEPNGCMVVDIGGGTTDVAVISLGGMVVHQSIKVAGDDCDQAIIKYIRKKYNLMIGERTAENIKINVGCAFPYEEEKFYDVKGRNVLTGLPINIEISSSEMLEALREPIAEIIEAVFQVLEKTPPELASDISNRGIVLTGGGSMIYGLDKLIHERTGIETRLAENAVECVAIGTGRSLRSIEILDKATQQQNGRRK